MKFRIVEQRGVFRIQRLEVDAWRILPTTESFTTGHLWWKRTEVEKSQIWGRVTDWETLGVRDGKEFSRRFIPARDLTLTGEELGRGTIRWNRVPPQVKEYEFDTYKKAENYIRKFYGSTGVDAIEKPEWRTA